MEILISLELSKQNRTRFLFCLLWFIMTSISIVVQWWPYTFSLSGDYGTHNSWIVSIMRHGQIDLGYPPLAYWLGAGVAKMLGSSVVAMNVITFVSLIVASAALLFIVSKTGTFNAWFTVAVFFLIYSFAPTFPLIGYEVIGNYFYSHFVSTAYMLVTISIFFVWRGGFESKLIFSLLVLFVGFYIYPLPVLVFYGATDIFLLLEITKKGFKKLWTWGIYVVFGAVIFLLNPSTRTIVQIADSNGWLSFPLLTRSPQDISHWGLAFILFAFILSSLMVVIDVLRWRKGIQDRVFSLINSTLFSVSGLATLQFALNTFGMSTPYAVKKYFFILGTFLIIEILFLFNRLVGYFFDKRIQMLVTQHCVQSEFILLFAPVLVAVLLIAHPLTDIRGLLKYEAEARFYRQFFANGDWPTIAKFNLPATFNYLISAGDLEVPIHDAWRFCYATNQELLSGFNGSLIIERDSMASSATWVGRDVQVVNYKLYNTESTTLVSGKAQLFNQSQRRLFLVDGFSSPEIWGVWSDASRSVMSFVVDPKSDVSLSFKVSPFLPKPEMVLSVLVEVNGARLAVWAFKYGDDYSVKTLMIPKEQVPADGIINLTFNYSKTNSPASLGVSADTRQLALGFIELQCK